MRFYSYKGIAIYNIIVEWPWLLSVDMQNNLHISVGITKKKPPN